MAEKTDETKKEAPEMQKVKALPKIGKISMWIEDYNDMFSDFDPRHYSERTISDDFLNESQKIFKERKEGVFELRLLVPKTVRNEKDEETIKKRLRDFFKANEKEIEKRAKKTILVGICLATLGFLFMMLATFILYLGSETLISNFLVVVFDPAGWFLVWYGLDQIFYIAKEIKKNYFFYKKVGNADIVFVPY